MKPEITKEKYEKYVGQKLKDVLIAKRFGISKSTLIYHKKKWYGEGKQ